MEWTNREAFCISCHEMKENVYVEYRNTIHYQNRTGVRATCPDCHVPKEWGPKIVRKIQASNEVLHKVLGSIDTPEKFNAKRAAAGPARVGPHEAQRQPGVPQLPQLRLRWTTPSRTGAPRPRTSRRFNAGQTCIDCHKGIAHTLPPIEQNIGAPKDDPAQPPAASSPAASAAALR